MRLTILAIAFTLFSGASYALSDNDGAAVTSFVSGIGQAGMTYISRQKIASWLTQNAVYNPVVAQKLTDENIQRISALVEESWFPRSGVGEGGGAEIDVVRPNLPTETMKVRMMGTPADLKTKLTAIKDGGGVISSVEVRTFIRGTGLRLVTGVLTVYAAGAAASNLYAAYKFAQGPTKPAMVNPADNSGPFEWLFNTGGAVFYSFKADQ